MASHGHDSESVLAKHTTAVGNLATKQSTIRMFSFGFRREPLNVDDIYSGSSRTRVPKVPADLQLPFVFANHNALYRANRTARPGVTTQLDFDVLRALWYWNIARIHTFSVCDYVSQANIILMLLMLARPDLQTLCKPGALGFINAYIAAWLEQLRAPLVFTAREAFLQIWNQGPHDLICFKVGQGIAANKNMRNVCEKLDGEDWKDQLQVPAKDADFVKFMQELSDEQFYQFGPTLALKWIRIQRAAQTGKKAEQEEEETGIEDMFQNFGIAKPSTYDLDLVDWDDELVKSVLVDVEHDVERPKAEWNKNSAWMNVELAFTMIKGQYTGPQGDGNGVQSIVEGLQDVAMDGDAMKE
jgi:hypothetical protein